MNVTTFNFSMISGMPGIIVPSPRHIEREGVRFGEGETSDS